MFKKLHVTDLLLLNLIIPDIVHCLLWKFNPMKYLALFLFFWSVLGAVAQICKHAFLKTSQVFPLILQNVLWQLVHKKPINRSFWSLLTHWWKQQHLLWIFCQIDLPCIIMIHAINHKTWLENFMSWKFMFIYIYIYICLLLKVLDGIHKQ